MSKFFNFLTEDQVFGKERPSMIRKFGVRSKHTDFYVLLGGMGNYWWTSSDYNVFDKTSKLVAQNDPDIGEVFSNEDRYVGARPSIKYSDISSEAKYIDNFDGVIEVEYGEYPQTVVDEDYSQKLDDAYFSGQLKETGKKYTTDSVNVDDIYKKFNPREHIEYVYNGKKYIRFKEDDNCFCHTLSDGRKIEEGKSYWVAVEPIKWLVDKDSNIALSENILFSGIQYMSRKESVSISYASPAPIIESDSGFGRFGIIRFMNEYFAKEIQVNNSLTKETDNSNEIIDSIKNNVISISDVINYNYTSEQIETMDIYHKFATAMVLSKVDEDHFIEVREFMKMLGDEPRRAFESMWANNNKKRLEILDNISFNESVGGLGM